jgi:hypothetical protein
LNSITTTRCCIQINHLALTLIKQIFGVRCLLVDHFHRALQIIVPATRRHFNHCLLSIQLLFARVWEGRHALRLQVRDFAHHVPARNFDEGSFFGFQHAVHVLELRKD